VVGHYAITPTALNHAGEKSIAGQAGDLMVHPSYQGMGLFLRLASSGYDLLRRKGANLVFGFPNKSSYPGFVRKLGWQPIARLRQYSMRLRYGILPAFEQFSIRSLSLAARDQRRKRHLRLAFRSVSRLPEDYGELWAKIAPYETLSVWKDPAYLNWRYLENPTASYQMFELRKDAELVALCVARISESECRIFDLLVQQKNVAIGKSIVREVVRFAERRGSSVVRYSGYDDGFTVAVFEGFYEELLELQYAVHAFGDDILNERARMPHLWAVSGGDLDVN
jgi:predicted N-acetyltransferase YhbS